MKDISIAERYSLLQEAGLQRSNIKKILEGYEVSNGAECNLRIWAQSRFEDALSPNKKMLLMPTIGCA